MKTRLPTTPRAAYARARVATSRLRSQPAPAVPTAEVFAALPVNCVVFSKDRPMQLDACLRSIDRFAPYEGSVTVIYRATSAEFERGYGLIMRSREATFVEQSNFQADVLTAISGQCEYIVFHTDDDLFYRTPPAAPLPTDGFAAFSLRLGANTTYCYSGATTQTLPSFSRNGPYLGWDWTTAHHDFAYPMSLDGHVFRTCFVQELLASARFGNPNQLEEELHLRRYKAPGWLLSFDRSCVVSIPLNIVSTTHANRASANPEHSPATLNDRFLAGERIALGSIEASSIRGAHQELALEFEPDEGRMTHHEHRIEPK